MSFAAEFYGNAVHPAGASDSPWGMRLQVTLLFPKLTDKEKMMLIEEKPKEMEEQQSRKTEAPQIRTAEEWQVGFGPGPGRQRQGPSTKQARLLPERGNYVGGPIALEIKDLVPALSFKSFEAFTAGAAARGGADPLRDTLIRMTP